MKTENYSAAALAAELGVPRTTLNDWLTRYDSYIDVQLSGKRKVYSAGTLEVLREVARLRDEGKSAAEIENFLEQHHGVTPEFAVESPRQTNAAAATEDASGDVAASDGQAADTPQLPSVKKFEENAMELAAFISELRKEQEANKKRSHWTAFMLLLVIIVLVIMLGAAVKAVRMQFAERQLEAVRMQQTLEKLNQDFSAELKAQEKLRQQERLAAEKSAALLKNELLKLQQANAEEVKRLAQQLADDRKNMQKELLKQEKELKNKSAAERKLLLKKMEDDARRSRQQLETLQRELAEAGKALQELNKKLDEKPIPAANGVYIPDAAATDAVTQATPSASGDKK